MGRRKLPNFQCPRCEYTTPDKDNFRKHLYKRSSQCPPANFLSIELTDEVKENVMINRIYVPPKPPAPIKQMAMTLPHNIDTTERNPSRGSIYLIWIREFKDQNTHVYKIGKSTQETGRRLMDYPDGSEVIHISTFPRHKTYEIEQQIIAVFQKLFKNHPDGREYFIGDPFIMAVIISHFNMANMGVDIQTILKSINESMECMKNTTCGNSQPEVMLSRTNPFGQETVSYMGDTNVYLTHILETTDAGVAEHIVNKHFNRSFPENNNVLFNKNIFSVFNGSKWTMYSLDRIYDMFMSEVKQDIERLITTHPPTNTAMITRFMEHIGEALEIELSDYTYKLTPNIITKQHKEFKKFLYLVIKKAAI